MPVNETQRGFGVYAEFAQRDYPGAATSIYTVQESSLASERKVWIGPPIGRAHLSESEARVVRDALSEFLGEQEPASEVEWGTASLEAPGEWTAQGAEESRAGAEFEVARSRGDLILVCRHVTRTEWQEVPNE